MRKSLFLAFFFLLAACGNASDTVNYTPPAAEGGRMCTNQCRLAQDYCNQACDYTYRSCVSSAQSQALKDYEKYAHEQLAAKEPLDLVYGDFVRTPPCNAAQKGCYNTCESNFGMCYTGCGGTKEVTSSCHFLCF